MLVRTPKIIRGFNELFSSKFGEIKRKISVMEYVRDLINGSELKTSITLFQTDIERS
jgi:hypothetical protein